MNFKETLEQKVVTVEKILQGYLPEKTGLQKTVLDAMHYSVEAGGKRLRPILMMETYHMFGGTGEEVYPFMAAMEMIHTYSLVHDDLPAMDNDEYRRGKKTTWVMYGDAMAVLTGDALLNYAFECVMKSFEKVQDDALRRTTQAAGVLSQKAGIYGMIGGQVVDVESEKKGEKITKEQLLFIHKNKTAALIEASLMCGAILAKASPKDVERLEMIGRNIGVAFQIQDDILDIEGSFEELGKPIGSDEKNEKVTYVSIYGMQKAKEDVSRLTQEAMELLNGLECRKNPFLEELLISLVHRSH